jgi:hypothetical protein
VYTLAQAIVVVGFPAVFIGGCLMLGLIRVCGVELVRKKDLN